MDWGFRDIEPDDKGILERLLTRSYLALKELNEVPWIPDDAIWQVYDDCIFGRLGSTNEEVFLTDVDGGIVGFASFSFEGTSGWIGRNAVIPEQSGKGIGTAQANEAIRRCRSLEIETLEVVTGAHPFFLPARRMYLRVGFQEADRYDD